MTSSVLCRRASYDQHRCTTTRSNSSSRLPYTHSKRNDSSSRQHSIRSSNNCSSGGHRTRSRPRGLHLVAP